jgi:hypothetical protein
MDALEKLRGMRGSVALWLCVAALAGCDDDPGPGGGLGTNDAGVMTGSAAGGASGAGASAGGAGAGTGGGAQGGADAGVAPGSDASAAPGSDSGAAPGTDAGGSTGGDAATPGSDAAAPDAGQPAGPFEGEGMPWTGTAPRATCGAGDKPDGEIAGLNTDVICNLQIVGKTEAPHFLSLAWHKDCAYVNGPDATTVIHVDAMGKPTVTTTLTELGMRSNWESMKANPNSGLLAGYESNGPTLTVYDLNADCKAPVHQSNIVLDVVPLIGSIGHAGSFSPDGTIYYASSMYTSQVIAVDLMMPKQPKVITSTFDHGAHDLFIGKNGTRGYFALFDISHSLVNGSFAIMDLTQVQARMPDAQGKVISEITWEDGNTSQYPILVTYGGKDHLIINDELGAGACGEPMKPQWGYTRIFDLSDEKMPKQLSIIKTEAQDPKNCEKASENAGAAAGFFGLGTHYCNVDRFDNPRLLSCGNFDAGVRVYDIRNPWRPKEVAYFDTPQLNVPSMQRIVVEKRELWVASGSSEFFVLKFTPGSAPDQILSQ